MSYASQFWDFMVKEGQLTEEELKKARDAAGKHFRRCEDMCNTILRTKIGPGESIKKGIDLLQQTWDAVSESARHAETPEVLLAWAPALRLLLDTLLGLEDALSEAQRDDPDYAKLLMQVAHFKGTGEFPPGVLQ